MYIFLNELYSGGGIQVLYNGNALEYTFTEDHDHVFYDITSWVGTLNEPQYTYTGVGTMTRLETASDSINVRGNIVRLFYGYAENVKAGDKITLQCTDRTDNVWTIIE